FGRSRVAAAGQFIKGFLQCACDGTRFAATDSAKVYLPQADDLGRCAADEDFISDIELIARDRLFNYFVTKIASQSDQAVACDSLKDRAARRSVDFSVARDEQILSGTFSDIALRIEHDGLVEASTLGFGLGKN